MSKKNCCDCGKSLKKDEVALSQKLIGIEITEFYCLPCLAEYIGCTVEDLEIKMQEFKEQGCTLFL